MNRSSKRGLQKKRRLWKKKEKMKSWCLNIASIAIKQWATARCVNFWIRRWENFRWRVWLATDVAYVIGILIKQLDKELGTCHDNEMTRSLFIVPSFRLTYRRFVWMLEGWEGWKKAWIMIVCARGARRNRVWDEMQPHLHRDATASAPRHVRTRGWVRQESVGHGSSTSQPYTPCMSGQNVV